MQIFWEIVASNALIVTVLALGVVLLSRFWRNPVGLHLLWVLILLKLCTPPIVTLHLPVPMARSFSQQELVSNESSTQPARNKISPEEFAATTVGNHNPHVMEDRPILASPSTDVESAPLTAQRNGTSWMMVLAWIWGVGIAGFTPGYTYRILRFRRLLGTARSPSASILSMAAEIASWLGLKHIPEIRMLPLRISPLVWSLGGKPRVLLPAALFESLDDAAQKAILTHELAHVRRKDHWVRWLELVMTTLFWWHPVVWWACRQLQSLEDQCCDAMLVGMTPQSAKTYAIALLDTLDFLSERPVVVPLGVTATRPQVSLSRRIAMLKNPPFHFRLNFGHFVLLAAAAALPMAIAFATEPPNQKAGSDAEKSSSPAQQNSGQGSENKPAKPEGVSIGEENRRPGHVDGSISEEDRPGHVDGSVSVKDLTHAAPAAASNPVPPELQKPMVGKNWVILPLHALTELQRNFRANYARGKLLVLINGKALLNDNNTVLNTAPLDMHALSTELGKYRKADVQGVTIIEIHGVPQRPQPRRVNGNRVVDEAEEHRLRAASVLSGWLRQATRRVTGATSINNAGGRDKDWNSFVADLIAPPTEEAMKREAGIGDDLVKVFPVLTPLSRHLLEGDWKINCMIRLVKFNDQYTPDEIKAIPALAKKFIGQLNLKEPASAFLIENFRPASDKEEITQSEQQFMGDLRRAFETQHVDVRVYSAFYIGDYGQPLD